MKTLSSGFTLLSLFVTVGLVLARVPLSDIKRTTSLRLLPNKFIVEVDTSANIPHKRTTDTFHEFLYRSLNERGITFQIDKQFKSEGVFVGASLTLSNAQDASLVQSLPGVTAIRPVRVLSPPLPIDLHVVKDPTDPNVPADTQSTHVLTGVDKLHAEGIFGAGVKIGIIDTGIDYNHPSLGAGFGPGHKVIGGYDFVGDAYNGTNTAVEDADPLDQCNGHGTHVAGIIGANPGNQFNISGVAYQASLSSYRVFGCSGLVSDDILIEALLKGVADGQDILTLSIGGVNGWTESSAAVVASRIANLGKVVTIAAGNDGSYGSWYASGPGTGENVIATASIDNTVVPLQNATINGIQHDPITYFNTLPLPINGTLPIYATSTNVTIANDACNPLPDSTPDLSGYAVVIRRGGCTFLTKLTNAGAKGAKVALIYNNGGSFSGISVGNFTATLIQAADGEFLVQQFVAKAPVTISFPQTGAAFNFRDPAGGLVSTFTSYGPSYDFLFRPTVAAPGGSILSTLPLALGAFGVESGTSMATPFMAGSAALLFSVRGKNKEIAKSAKMIFQTTAQRVSSSHTDGDPLQTLTQQGAGLVDAYKAAYTTTIVSPGELILNDTTHFKPIQAFTILNSGREAQNYTLTHVPAGTAVTIENGTMFANDGPVPLTTDYASVEFSESHITVLPGVSYRVVLNFTPPKITDPSTYPVYSGFINIASDTESTQVSYIGLSGSLKDKQVVDNTDTYFCVKIPAFLDSTGNPQANSTNYTFAGADFPTLLFRLAFGTPVFKVDLVAPDVQVTTNLRKRDGAPAPFFSFPNMEQDGTFTQVKIIGSLAEFDYVPRNSYGTTVAANGYNTISFPEAVFANGTAIAKGQYRVLVRALRVTGDASKEEDYESWLSPVVGVV